MAALGKQVSGRALSYLSVQRGRSPASYGSGHGTTKRYADQREVARVTARRLGALATILFALSWCVPVIETHGDLLSGRSWGWQAFLFAVSPLLGNDMDAHPLQLAWMVSSALTNLVLVVTLGLLFWRPLRIPSALAWVLVGAALVNAGWLFLPTMLRDLRVGFYLWLCAFVVGAAAALLHLHQRTSRAGDGAAAA